MSRFKIYTGFGIFLLCTLSLFLYIKFKPTTDSNTIDKAQKKQYPADWFFAQRAYPDTVVNPAAYLDAMQQAQLAKHTRLATRGATSWVFAGPTNGGGRITSIAVPASNPQTIYVGAAAGGVFKTIDGGTSWNPIFDDALTLSIGDLAVAPSNPQIVYVGTGEANGGGGSTNYDGVGVYKSLNGGSTWQHLGPTGIGSIGKVVIDAKNPNRVFVASMGYLYQNSSKRGVYRTTNGGSTWQKVLYLTDSTGCIDLAMHPTNPDTIYAALWERSRKPHLRDYGGSTCGIFRSINGGETWVKLRNGLPTTDIGRIGITISPKDPSVLYAIYATESGDNRGIYRSNNNGETWFPIDPNNYLQFMYSGFGWWFGKIYADPTDVNIVYALGVESYRSVDGGQTWQTFTGFNHVDHHALWINPNDNQHIIDGNDGGIYISKDFANSWTYYNTLPISQFYTCEIDESNPQRLYGGTQDNGTWRTMDGSPNAWQRIFGGDGSYCLVDPIDNNYVYAESQNGNMVRFTDGGQSYFNALTGIVPTDRENWQTPFVFSTANPATLYYGTHRLYRSTDRAVNWQPISPDLTRGNGGIGGITFGTITTISVSPMNAKIIYVGTDDGNAWVTLDEGINWKKINKGLPNRWITRITADPFNQNTAYLTVSGFKWNEYQPHVFKTTDLGDTWTDISANLPQAPANDVIPDPSVQGTLYVATDVGVYVAYNDNAPVWELLGTGMPLSPVTDLTFHKPTRKLVAATYGRSMYYTHLPPATPTQDIAETVSNFTINPSPLTSFATISFHLKNTALVDLDIIDISGRLVKTVLKGRYTEGGYQPTLSRFELGGSGIYLCRLKVGNSVKTVKFIVL